jgi:hypothetical protein
MAEAEIQAALAASLLSVQEDESRRQAQEAAQEAQQARNAHIALVNEAALAEALAESEHLARFEEEIRQAAEEAHVQQQREAELEEKSTVSAKDPFEQLIIQRDQLILENSRLGDQVYDLNDIVYQQRARIEELEARVSAMMASTSTFSTVSTDLFVPPRPLPASVRNMPAENLPTWWTEAASRTRPDDLESVGFVVPEFRLTRPNFSEQAPSAPSAPSTP